MQVMGMKQLIRYLYTIQSTADGRIPSVLIEGPTGVGKSSLIRQFSRCLKVPCTIIELALFEPSDIAGLLQFDGTGKHYHTLPDWMPREGEKQELDQEIDVPKWVEAEVKRLSDRLPLNLKGVCFLDEIWRCHPDVASSVMNLILNQKLHNHYLPEGWMIIMASNPCDEGEYLVNEPDPAVLDRSIGTVKLIPDFDEWKEYARPHVHPGMISFLEKQPAVLRTSDERPDPKKDTSAGIGTLTFRKAFMLGKVLKQMDELDFKEFGLHVIGAAVPKEIALTLYKEIKEGMEVIDPKDIVHNYPKIRERVLTMSQGKEVTASIITDAVGKLGDYLKKVKKAPPIEGIEEFLKTIPREIAYQTLKLWVTLDEPELFTTILNKLAEDQVFTDEIVDISKASRGEKT